VKAFLLLLTALAVSCSEPTSPAPAPAPPASALPAPRPSLDDLPVGAPPRIGYVHDQVYVEPGGRRTPLPRRLGVSGIVPFAGGFLISDTRYFEGTVGLHRLSGGRSADLSACSSGVPTVENGWVTWLVLHCSESADVVRAGMHRARPDGSEETVRRIPPRSVRRVAPSPLSVPVPDLPRRWYASASVREGARQVLAVVTQGRWIAIVRIGPGDALERATPVERFDPDLPAYGLGPGRSGRPRTHPCGGPGRRPESRDVPGAPALGVAESRRHPDVYRR
jgi:hypothetical protein